MKWIKLETNFWDSETAHVLDEHFGDRGLVAYLRLLTTIGKDIQTADDVVYAHDIGWTKSLRDWAYACKTKPKYLRQIFIYLDSLGKISALVPCFETQKSTSLTRTKFTSSSPVVNYAILADAPASALSRITIRFKNIHEFVDKRALSSNYRSPKNDSVGTQLGTQLGPEDKIRGAAAMPPPEGEGGHSHATQVTKKNADGHIAFARPLSKPEKKNFGEHQRKVLAQAEWVKQGKPLEDFVFASAESDGMASWPPTDPLQMEVVGNGKI